MYHIFSDSLFFSARNTKVYKICQLCKAIFSLFYNILQPNLQFYYIWDALSSFGPDKTPPGSLY